MSMETTAWTQLHSVMTAQQERRPFDRATLRRIAAFARPHRGGIVRFVLLGVLTALLAVATSVLAGHVVDAIVSGHDTGTVVRLSLLIALVAVAEAALGVLGRRLSSALGEGLILDLRTAVFDHVQRMPVAFFTRTRTGALVSRLNNDVIGAQRAFANTLSGVVSNLVTLLLTLAVMLTLSWQITLLALVLLLGPGLVEGQQAKELVVTSKSEAPARSPPKKPCATSTPAPAWNIPMPGSSKTLVQASSIGIR